MSESPEKKFLERYAAKTKKVEKPWGWELIFAHTDRYCGKLLFVRAGHQLSLQFHRDKDETLYVQSGRAEFEIGPAPGGELREDTVGPGAAFRIEPGTVHRIRGVEDTLLLEVSTPELDDVVRLKDQYGRASK